MCPTICSARGCSTCATSMLRIPAAIFEVGIDAPDATIPEMVERLLVDPSLTFTKIFLRRE